MLKWPRLNDAARQFPTNMIKHSGDGCEGDVGGTDKIEEKTSLLPYEKSKSRVKLSQLFLSYVQEQEEEREAETDRQTDLQVDRQTSRQAYRQADTDRDGEVWVYPAKE